MSVWLIRFQTLKIVARLQFHQQTISFEFVFCGDDKVLHNIIHHPLCTTNQATCVRHTKYKTKRTMREWRGLKTQERKREKREKEKERKKNVFSSTRSSLSFRLIYHLHVRSSEQRWFVCAYCFQYHSTGSELKVVINNSTSPSPNKMSF